MTGNVFELFPEGQPYDGMVCESCGSAWWNAEILMDTTGRINGWGRTADCAKCGKTQTTITGDVHDG